MGRAGRGGSRSPLFKRRRARGSVQEEEEEETEVDEILEEIVAHAKDNISFIKKQ